LVIIGGNTTGVNLSKGAIIQVGYEMEEAARVSRAGWVHTYIYIWLPLLMPLLILLATLNFVSAAGATASVILLASRETVTLSVLALQLASPEVGQFEEAAIVNLHISALTLGVAAIARRFGLNIGIRHR
jgi:ABC-type Fe3+ transport system permease subunit